MDTPSRPESVKVPGYVQRLARKYQSLYRLSWAAALQRAKEDIGGAAPADPPADSTDTAARKAELEDMTVDELRELCSTRGYSGYSSLNKAALVEFILEAEAGE